MDRKQNTWITCVLLVPAILSASVLFSLAEIHVDTFLIAVIYGSSVCGFVYLYLGAATFALNISKPTQRTL
jgi:uncharacterized membrane protein YdjX (TVP38/TMEM64 family)